jgi:hypothetical protein
MALDQLSLATLPITPLFEGTTLSQAPSFVWKRRDHHYLITNWHVASATHLFTKKPLRTDGCRPNVFRCHFIVRIGSYDRARVDIPIRDRDDNPIWLVHPLQDRRPVDIAAIPLAAEELRGSVSLLPVNDLAPGKLAIMVGMEVFILGYPFGSALPAFPGWKRRSIASEPDLVKLTTRYYLVDTAPSRDVRLSGHPEQSQQPYPRIVELGRDGRPQADRQDHRSLFGPNG